MDAPDSEATAGADAPTQVAIGDLDLTLRLRAPDPNQIRMLADVLDRCPPIVVQRDSLRLLDGHARVAAASAAGRAALPVSWVDGDDASALEIAIAANSAHGRPLTSAERNAAARRLLGLAPFWSNRRVAASCGISEATVRRIRPAASPTQQDSRVGADGKVYPVGEERRQHAKALLRARPDASDRALARACGLSATTIGRVRREADHPIHPPVTIPTPQQPRSGRSLRHVLRHLWCLLRWWRGRRRRDSAS